VSRTSRFTAWNKPRLVDCQGGAVDRGTNGWAIWRDGAGPPRTRALGPSLSGSPAPASSSRSPNEVVFPRPTCLGQANAQVLAATGDATGTIAAGELGEFPEGLRDAADGEEVRVAAIALPRRCAGRPRAATRTTRTVDLGQGSMQLAAAFALSPVNLIPDFII
jgi:hypothetical protein